MTDFCQHVMVAHVQIYYPGQQILIIGVLDVSYSTAPTMLGVFLAFISAKNDGPFTGGKIYLVFFGLALWISQRF